MQVLLAMWVAGATRQNTDLMTSPTALAAATTSLVVGGGSAAGWGAFKVEDLTASTGTKIVFNWGMGLWHNVVMTTEAAFTGCTLGDEDSVCLATDTGSATGDCDGGSIVMAANGNYKYEAVLSNAGEYYFICGVPGHCGSQKVKVTVIEAGGAPSAGTCADGSSPGSNGCCAATNECPPCFVKTKSSSSATPSAESTTCTCSGCAGDTVTIDATCTSDSCLAMTPIRTGVKMMACEFCSGSDGTCMPNQAAVTGCSNMMPGLSVSSLGLISAQAVLDCKPCCPTATCSSQADVNKPECAACVACNMQGTACPGANPCGACCPVGTCDSAADGSKPECAACLACQTSGTCTPLQLPPPPPPPRRGALEQ